MLYNSFTSSIEFHFPASTNILQMNEDLYFFILDLMLSSKVMEHISSYQSHHQMSAYIQNVKKYVFRSQIVFLFNLNTVNV